MVSTFFFFFFQAEDGIRDLTVTGVQTWLFRSKVKDGYARNYLLPKGLAYPATEANKKKITYEAQRIANQRAVEKTAAEAESLRLAEGHLTFPVKVGEEDKLYGSVTAGGIQRPLEELGIHVDQSQR